MNNNVALQDWYNGIKERGQSKALAEREQRLIASTMTNHTINKGKIQFPVIAKTLADRTAKRVDNAPKIVDTLDSLFNIF